MADDFEQMADEVKQLRSVQDEMWRRGCTIQKLTDENALLKADLEAARNRLIVCETFFREIERTADAEAEIASEYDYELERGRARAYAELKKRVSAIRAKLTSI